MYVALHTRDDELDLRVEGIGGQPGREPEAAVHAHFHRPDVFISLTPAEARTIASEFMRAANQADVAYAALQGGAS
jgi:hypothetical protein